MRNNTCELCGTSTGEVKICTVKVSDEIIYSGRGICGKCSSSIYKGDKMINKETLLIRTLGALTDTKEALGKLILDPENSEVKKAVSDNWIELGIQMAMLPELGVIDNPMDSPEVVSLMLARTIELLNEYGVSGE